MVHRFPVHDRESERTRPISLSHSENREMQISLIYSSSCILGRQILVGHRENRAATARLSWGHPPDTCLRVQTSYFVTPDVCLSRLESGLGGRLCPLAAFLVGVW